MHEVCERLMRGYIPAVAFPPVIIRMVAAAAIPMTADLTSFFFCGFVHFTENNNVSPVRNMSHWTRISELLLI